MKRSEGVVEILEAFDLAGSYRAAAELAGCSHHTVARYARLRAAGRVLTERAVRDRLLHHAHVIVTEGQSHRLKEAIEGHGVRLLVPAS